jgi:tetratricopeptide (TPR) repeat protein
MRYAATLGLGLALAANLSAGLHYSAETLNPLPAKWRGYLLDHRALRLLAAPKALSPLAESYAEALNKLESLARTRTLTADEAADLGAILVRLGKADKAVEILRPATRAHPRHFRLAANLGTAWQLAGDLEQAELALADAVELAPPDLRPAESAHLKLVRLRRKEGKSPADAPDALFDKTPDAAILQRLALGLPADGRLLWQLAILAHDAGDLRTAANILDGCVVEFGMKSDAIRKQRTVWRAAVDDLDKRGHADADRGTLAFKSSRPLLRAFDESRLPAINPNGPTELPWAALAETTLGKRFAPKHLKFVDALDGKAVSIVGYVRPQSTDADLTEFLFTEFPVGCWFCELPEPNGMVAVTLAAGKTVDAVKTPVKVTGTLKLNRDDPETYLFAIVDARVGAAD